MNRLVKLLAVIGLIACLGGLTFQNIMLQSDVEDLSLRLEGQRLEISLAHHKTEAPVVIILIAPGEEQELAPEPESVVSL